MNLSAPKYFIVEKADIGWIRTTVCTAIALIAFAANSILCRLALGSASIDAASFSTIRLTSGALVLVVIVWLTPKDADRGFGGNWISAGMLFLDAVTFSFTCISLTAGTGVLVLSGSVQAAMILSGLRRGERFGWLELCGLIIAIAGLIYLVLQSSKRRHLGGAALMTAAGIARGVYSLHGRGVANPTETPCGKTKRSASKRSTVRVLNRPMPFQASATPFP
jgi:drug/metabolite transporter (DMT)-like permease